MLEQIGESFRKVTESSLQTQQDMVTQWAQQWQSTSHAAKSSPELGNAMERCWLEAATHALESSRELVDSGYRAIIRLSEQSFEAAKARSPDQYRAAVEQLYRSLSEITKTHSEANMRALQSTSARLLDLSSQRTAASTP
jgi:hypothetical protein